MKDKSETIIEGFVLFFSGLIAVLIAISFLWGLVYLYKEYSIWSNAMEGKADLAKATYTRQIAIKEALAKKDSAVLLADAEVERAQGVAKANKIIGQSLNNNESYLRYLWIQNLANEHNQVIYVPTEANLPILEANRLKEEKNNAKS